jgi:hypothetical protein
MLDLSTILGLISQFAGVDIGGQISMFADTFAYSILLWLLNLGGVI